MARSLSKFAFVVGYLLVLPVLLLAVESLAEEGEKGRLADGRAYRTDNQGNEIVDYIAELELANDALTRRVRGLESEIDEKNLVLQRSGRGVEPKLVERTLLEPALTIQPLVNDSQANDTRAASEPVLAELIRTKSELSRLKEAKQEEQENAQQRINFLENSLKTRSNTEKESEYQRAALASTECISTLTSRIGVLESSLSKKAEELDRSKRDLTQTNSSEGETQRLRSELQKVETQNGELRNQLRAVTASLRYRSAGEEEVQSLRTKIASLQSALDEKNKAVQVAVASGYVRAKDATDLNVEVPVKDAASTLAPARARAIQSLRGKLSTEVNNLRALFTARDSLYRTYTKNGGRVTFNLARPVSSRGIGIQEITGRLKAVTSVIELSTISRDISEIRVKVEEDMRLIKRMTKVK